MAKWLGTSLCTRKMMQVLVYSGEGMYEADTLILERVMKEHVNRELYNVDTVSAAEIIQGRLEKETALLVIGGGYDLGLIQALGQKGMKNIKEYVSTGGSYLGICSGAYFACDRIEFDKGGPLEVIGERFLKFYSGTGVGPLFKPYDYQSRKGASAVNLDFNFILYESNGYENQTEQTRYQSKDSNTWKQSGRTILQGLDPDVCHNDVKENDDKSYVDISDKNESQRQITESHACNLSNESQQHVVPATDIGLNLPAFESNDTQNCQESLSEKKCTKLVSNNDIVESFSCKVYFNGGSYFRMNEGIPEGTTVMSHYLDLPDCPAAILRCQVGKGVAVLSGAHLEYDAEDIDDGDSTVTDIIPHLKDSANQRRLMISSILKQLNIVVQEI